jgi:hypothetical protein
VWDLLPPDQRHVGIRLGRRIRHLGHLHINRFFKSRRDSAGDLLGITEHRLVDHKALMLDHFLAVGTLFGCQLSRSLLGAPSAQVDRRQPASRRQR